MKTLFFALPGNEKLTASLLAKAKGTAGKFELRKFPDGETYVRVLSEVKNQNVILVCTLHEPDEKLLPLYFLSKTLKGLGAVSVKIIAPYLAYMRQDKVFHPGEGVTSTHFAQLLSGFADALVAIDPHLHRRSSLSEIYSIPTSVGHAAEVISRWIKNNIEHPVLIGPDGESEQWVSAVAKGAEAPFTVLQKIRHGDREVEVSIPRLEQYKNQTPVLVDDIISTGRTMIATIAHLKKAGMKAPVCIGVHAVFAGNAYEEIRQAGARQIVTCNTIPHPSNAIAIDDLLVKNLL